MFSAKQLSKFPRGHTCPLLVVILALLFPLSAHADVVLDFDACPPGNLETYSEDGFLITWIGFGDRQLAVDVGGGDMALRDAGPSNASGAEIIIRTPDADTFVLGSVKANDFTDDPLATGGGFQFRVVGYLDGSIVATDILVPQSATFTDIAPTNLAGQTINQLRINLVSLLPRDDWGFSEITLTGIDAGTVLVGNLGEAIDGASYATGPQWFASAFETDAHAYQLNSVTYKLTPGQFPSSTVSFARVYMADGAGMPGALVGELTNPAMPRDVFGDYLFTADTPLDLQANQRYLVCVGSQVHNPDQRASWHYTSSATSSGPGTMLPGMYFSGDDGASWTLAYASRRPLYQVDALQVESTMVRKEIPVTFEAHSSMFFKAELVSAGQPDEMLKITLPTGTEVHRRTLDHSIVTVRGKSGDFHVLTAKEVEMLKALNFDTGWIPGGSPIQIRIFFNASEGNVDVTEVGRLILEYDEALIGPGMNVPVSISWEADPGQGSVHMDGGVVFSASYKVNVRLCAPWPFDGTCWNLGGEGDLPGIPNVDMGWIADETFQPFLLDGASVTCEDDFDGVPFMLGPDIGVGSLEIGAQISGNAKGVLKGQTLCLDWGGSECTLTDGETIVRSFTVSSLAASTNLSIPQSYEADYPFDLTFDICPDGCVSVGICPVCAGVCITDFVSTPCVDFTALNDMDIPLNFNSPVAEVTIDGMMPEITTADYAVTKAVGETVIITGKHFGIVEGEVRFGSVPAPITTWSHTMIQATVPEGAESGLCVETVVGESPIFDFDNPVSAPVPNPLVYDLHPNYPNPFNPSTNIRFDLPVRGEVSIRIFDPAGRLVRTLVRDREFVAGQHSVVWNGKDDSDSHVASGIYYFQMRSASFEATRHMTLVR